MPKKKIRSLRCPTCRKLVIKDEPEFPFCSERCRTIDLGKWASGGYVISTPLNDPESGGEAEYTERPSSASRRTGPADNEPNGNKPN
jgi:endogenous inhibitor of DNA gyrase (YacG/DUF329 family)